MIFKPLHFCFLAVLFVMSLGVSAHLAFTGHYFSLAVALASWSVFVVASMFVVVSGVIRHWFTTGTELGAHCSNTGSSAHYSYDPPYHIGHGMRANQFDFFAHGALLRRVV